MDTGVHIRLRHLIEDTDRHGNVRCYVRVPGRKKVRIREQPGTEAFMAEYHAAVAGIAPAANRSGKAAVGSFRWLCQTYFASLAFKRLDAVTQAQRRYHLEELCEKHAGKPVGLLRPKHIMKMVEKLADTPAAANARLKALRAMFKWGFKNLDEVEHNPTLEVDRIAYHSDGHHSWTAEELAQYEQRHPIGTKARLGMALLLYSACRREDAPRLGPQHIDQIAKPDGTLQKRLRYRQAKNEHRAPIDVDMPLAPELEVIIAATPLSGHLTFLVTDYGRPYTTAGFGNAMKDWCRQANLPHCSAHGLRKARSAQIAEAGGTPHELMAVTGHQSLEEVERYTRAAQRSKLADAAMAKLK